MGGGTPEQGTVEVPPLPGQALVARGLLALQADARETPEALALAVMRRRLAHHGLPVPRVAGDEDAELAFYRVLAERVGLEAHGRMNAWLRELDSFAAAIEQPSLRPLLPRSERNWIRWARQVASSDRDGVGHEGRTGGKMHDRS